jgi:hypothetical protein
MITLFFAVVTFAFFASVAALVASDVASVHTRLA